VDDLVGLPGFVGGFENVDYGVFGRENVVVALRDADTAQVVLEVDAWESKVREGTHGWVSGVVGEAGAGQHGLHGVHVGHGWLIDGCWRLDEAWHAGVLRHGEAAGGVGWWRASVEAVHGIVASVGHGRHGLRHCGVCC